MATNNDYMMVRILPDGDLQGCPIPYDTATGRIKLLTDLREIAEFERAVRSITDDLPGPIRIGSIFRVPVEHYAGWGIGITSSNREALERMALESYTKPPQNTRDEMYQFKKSLSQGDILGMARVIANIVEKVTRERGEGSRKLDICDIPTGWGTLVSTMATIINADSNERLSEVQFHLIDRSGRKLEDAQNNLRQIGARSVAYVGDDEEFLANARSRGMRFDVIVSLAHMHRKPFVGPYLEKLHGILNDGGLLIIGDYHSTMSHHPMHAYDILSRLVVENASLKEARMQRFRALFGPLMAPNPNCRLGSEERQALADHTAYWGKMLTSPERMQTEDLEVYILGGFRSSRQLSTELNQAGFVTDREQIRRAFKIDSKLPCRLRRDADTIAISIAMKRG